MCFHRTLSAVLLYETLTLNYGIFYNKEYILQVSGAESQFDRPNNQGFKLVRNWDIFTALCSRHFCMKPLTTLKVCACIDRDVMEKITL